MYCRTKTGNRWDLIHYAVDRSPTLIKGVVGQGAPQLLSNAMALNSTYKIACGASDAPPSRPNPPPPPPPQIKCGANDLRTDDQATKAADGFLRAYPWSQNRATCVQQAKQVSEKIQSIGILGSSNHEKRYHTETDAGFGKFCGWEARNYLADTLTKIKSGATESKLIIAFCPKTPNPPPSNPPPPPPSGPNCTNQEIVDLSKQFSARFAASNNGRTYTDEYRDFFRVANSSWCADLTSTKLNMPTDVQQALRNMGYHYSLVVSLPTKREICTQLVYNHINSKVDLMNSLYVGWAPANNPKKCNIGYKWQYEKYTG
jgi:hypothetical protein